MNRFDGRRVIITGTGSGIGSATAQLFASEGAHVACLDIKGANETATAIKDAGGRAHAVAVDVGNAASCMAAVDDAVSELGGVDTLCNIAGIGHFAWSHEEDPDAFDRVIRVNLSGTFYMCRAVLPHMLEAGKGVIINTASNSGLQGQPWSAAYCSSKGGVVQLTRALAQEYIKKGIRVNAVAPGQTNTNIIHSFMTLPEGGNFKDMHRMMSPMGASEPIEQAQAFAYIASDAARYMTGTILTLDGGLTS